MDFRTTIRSIYHKLMALTPPRFEIGVKFYRTFGYWPDLRNPKTFSEKIQHRKLTENSQRLVTLADKVACKAIVSSRIGSQHVIPTLWHGTLLPPREERRWPIPFVIKANHASGWNYFVREESDLDWDKIERLAAEWLQTPWPARLHERHYNRMKRQLLVEPLIDSLDKVIDYKFFVFGGRVEFVQVDTDRFTGHRRRLFNREWSPLDVELQYPLPDKLPAKPQHFGEMLEFAERLSDRMDFVRIDFYDMPERPLFGEFTFMPGSGFETFNPSIYDEKFGEMWRVDPPA